MAGDSRSDDGICCCCYILIYGLIYLSYRVGQQLSNDDGEPTITSEIKQGDPPGRNITDVRALRDEMPGVALPDWKLSTMVTIGVNQQGANPTPTDPFLREAKVMDALRAGSPKRLRGATDHSYG